MSQIYASDLPYPSINVVENPSEAKLLMPLYAGSQSELSAIMTYAFQKYVTPKYPKIAKTLEGIAIVEMRHHALLGEAIYALGGYPIMGARTYWNGSFVNYALNPKTYLKQNVNSEQNTILNYEHTLLNLTQDSLKSLVERIVLDEQIHVKLFKELLQSEFEETCT